MNVNILLNSTHFYNGRHFEYYDVEVDGTICGMITATNPRIDYDKYDRSRIVYSVEFYTDVTICNGECKTDNKCLYKEFKTLAEAKYAFIEEYKANPTRITKKETFSDIKGLPQDSSAEFFPTPKNLAGLMISGIKNFRDIDTVLEPSAGKGDLAEAFIIANKKAYDKRYGYSSTHRARVDCIEQDTNLQYILEGMHYNVIFDDFLHFNTVKSYDLILMNPPFSNGCKHLLKAIEIQRYGGQICCLLNAETLRNPFSNERKMLISLLSKYNASVKYVNNAFASAERKARVDVAIVWIDIPRATRSSSILEGLKKAEQEEQAKTPDITDVVSNNPIEALVARYNTECKLCREFLSEYQAIKPYIMSSAKERQYDKPIIELKINGKEDNTSINTCINALRIKYWRYFFQQEELTSKFTSELQNKYSSLVNEMVDFDFNTYNLNKILTKMNSELISGVEEEIYKTFDKLSSDYSWYPESTKTNIHYFNGWKTNKAHKVGMKAIIPANGVFSSYSWDKGTFNSNAAYNILSGIEKVLNYLDGGATQEVSLSNVLDYRTSTKNIECKYFTVTFYKKGTVHINFKPQTERLIDALNIFVCRGRNWLPPHYGTKSYNCMTEEEKAVIDDFEGAEKYNEVCKHPEIYLYEIPKETTALLLA